MNETVHATHVDAPAEAVWSILVDIRTLPDLSPSTVEVEGPSRLEAVGDRFRQVVRLGGRRFRSEWEVVALDPGCSLTVRGSVLPGTRYEIAQRVTPEPGGGSCIEVRLRWKLPFGPLGRLAGKLGAERRAIAEAADVVQGIRRLAEAAGVRS